jgi:hypothetical protein
MDEGILAVLAVLSSAMAAAAFALSILILRRVSQIREDGARLAALLRFREMESRHEGLLKSTQLGEESLRDLTTKTRTLGADVSKMFAGIAGLLSETHRLEGNPHPKINAGKLQEINDRLLSLGDSSLGATRTAESLAILAGQLRADMEKLRGDLEGEQDRDARR